MQIKTIIYKPNLSNSTLFEVSSAETIQKGIKIFMKRDDLIHPIISGNKWRKLYHNINFAIENSFTEIITYGGPWSNHLLATAEACRISNLNLTAIIRGEQPKYSSKVLSFLEKLNFKMVFIPKTDYDIWKYSSQAPDFIKLHNPYIIPEGGRNNLGIKGCEAIVDELRDFHFDYICTPAGSGTTARGILRRLNSSQKLCVFAPFKQEELLRQFILKEGKAFEFITEFHFGGFSKIPSEVKQFVRDFSLRYNIQLDYIYNGKMMYGIFEKIKRGDFADGSVIVAIHTGGVQGNSGFE